jgi:hypothetical protein
MNRTKEKYIYDHLGQRMLKIGEAPTYFAYDILGNGQGNFLRLGSVPRLAARAMLV